MALDRVAPVSMPRPVLGSGSWAPPAWRAGDLVLLRLVGFQDGMALLQGAEGRVWRLPGSDPRLANLPAGTPLSWTVVSTRPQLALQLQGAAAPAAEEMHAGTPPPTASTEAPATPPSARPAAGPALSDLRPDAEILRLIHPLSAEATRLAFQWRRQVLTGTGRGSDARERWRQRAAAGALPWGLLAGWLAREDTPDEDSPPPPRPARFELTLGPLRLGLLLVEPEPDPDPAADAPQVRPLALRVMVSPPDWGAVVLQIELGQPGLRLRLAAAEAAALARLQARLPQLTGLVSRLGLTLRVSQLDRLGPDMALWTPPAGRVRPARLPPLLFRVAAELCLALWADELARPAPRPRRASAQ